MNPEFLLECVMKRQSNLAVVVLSLVTILLSGAVLEARWQVEDIRSQCAREKENAAKVSQATEKLLKFMVEEDGRIRQDVANLQARSLVPRATQGQNR